MEAISEFLAVAVGYAWGLPLVLLSVGGGLYLTFVNRGIQFRAFRHAVRVLRGKYDSPEDEGEITHFQALSASLSATIGLGNIAGVAVAMSAGGPGALVWMWLAALYRNAPYRWVYLGALFLGAVWKLQPVLDFSDIMYASMIVPNLTATLLLSFRVRRAMQDYMARYGAT